MISQEETRARVAKGAAHLDQVNPDWFRLIDIGVLDLGCGCLCILGQVFRGYVRGLDKLNLRNGHEHGFSLHGGPYAVSDYDDEDNDDATAAYQRLQDAWIDAIADRRLAQPETLAAVDPGVQSIPEGLRA